MLNNIKKSSIIEKLLSLPSVFYILLIMVVFFTIAGWPSFLTIGNVLSLTRQGSLLIILCMGVIVVKISGGIDLATGGIMTFSGMVLAWSIVNWNFSIFAACLLAILVAVLFGFLNGFFVSVLKVPSFIATLGTQSIAIGLSLGMNEGNVIGGLPDTLKPIGNGDLFGIPTPFLITLFVILGTYFLLNYSKFGVYVYAIGGNEEALKLSGKPVTLLKILAYTFSGLTAGIATLIMTSRNMAAQPTAGLGMEFEAFAGVVLGGSFMAGRGTASGAALGAIVIIVLRNGLNILGIPTYIQLAIFGTVLISAIVASTIVERNVQKLTEVKS